MFRKLALPTLLIAAMYVVAPNASADSTVSYTGTFASSGDTELETLVLTSSSNVTLQTWGFGGGTNGAGEMIAPGGFDPLLAVFSGTGSGATILTDGMGNAIATSDTLSNYSSYMGCPPAGEVNIGGSVCGDITMSLSLSAGTYTLLISDANYIPNAVFDNGTLGEGFTDFTGGAFQTCNVVGSTTTCATDDANWAFDVTTSGSSTPPPMPEPPAFFLLAAGLFGVAVYRSCNRAFARC